MNVYFQTYQNHYPNYLINNNSDEVFQNWKIHFVTPETPGSTVCFFHNAALELVPYIEQPLASDFYYCGTYSRQPTKQRERNFIKALDAFLALIIANPLGGAVQILGQNSIDPALQLNPDIEFFFSLLLEPFIETDERIPQIINLSPKLSTERENFVQQAAQNLDLLAVLNTTGACLPKP